MCSCDSSCTVFGDCCEDFLQGSCDATRTPCLTNSSTPNTTQSCVVSPPYDACNPSCTAGGDTGACDDASVFVAFKCPRGRLNNRASKGHCSCDASCSQYDDCCDDYLLGACDAAVTFCPEPTTTTSTTTTTTTCVVVPPPSACYPTCPSEACEEEGEASLILFAGCEDAGIMAKFTSKSGVVSETCNCGTDCKEFDDCCPNRDLQCESVNKTRCE